MTAPGHGDGGVRSLGDSQSQLGYASSGNCRSYEPLANDLRLFPELTVAVVSAPKHRSRRDYATAGPRRQACASPGSGRWNPVNDRRSRGALKGGAQGRNRTTDTRIFSPI